MDVDRVLKAAEHLRAAIRPLYDYGGVQAGKTRENAREAMAEYDAAYAATPPAPDAVVEALVKEIAEAVLPLGAVVRGNHIYVGSRAAERERFKLAEWRARKATEIADRVRDALAASRAPGGE